MQVLKPSQSVNNVRFLTSAGAVLLTLSTPATLVSSLTNSPAAIVWS